MKSKSVGAFLTTTASLVISLILAASIPLRLISNLIKPNGWRTALQVAMVISIFGGLIILITPLTHDGLSDAFRSTNIRLAVGEDGDQFIQSVGLISFKILGAILAGSIAVIAVWTSGSIFNFPLISPARAEGIIKKYGLMEQFSSFAELNEWGVHNIRERQGLSRLETSGGCNDLESTPSSGIWYFFGLLPCVIGSYFLPIFWGESPNFYWIDNAGGIFADAASYIFTLGKGGINLRGWIWAVPIACLYYGITASICFKYSKLTFNILLISHLEEQDVLLSRQKTENESDA